MGKQLACWRTALVALLLLVFVSGLTTIRPAAAGAPSSPRALSFAQAGQAEVIEDSYIVVYRDDVFGAASMTDSLEKSGKIRVKHKYDSAIRGFSAEMSAEEAEKLKKDSRVALVEPNRKIYKFGTALDYGVDRTNADLNSFANINNVDQRVGVDIAIIDDGVGPHSLIDVEGGADCANSGTYSGNGSNQHGTFVAGLAAGIDNVAGYPGVAPGARIWSVKVFNGEQGSTANLVCAMNWLYANRNTIEVANMSLGGECPYSDSMCGAVTFHNLVAQNVAAGVTIVVAAGNESTDTSRIIPARFSEVITVSALADSDGKPGAFGAPSYVSTPNGPYFLGNDDGFATFSNYGTAVDIAAPGVDVCSTFPFGDYACGNGTSFSSPLVAGAAALYVAEHGDDGPAAIKSWLLARRDRAPMPGDPDGINEGILNASGQNPASISLSRTSAQVDHQVTVNLSGFEPFEVITLKYDKTVVAGGSANGSGTGAITFKVPAGVKGNHTVMAGSQSWAPTKTLSISPRIRLSPTTGVPGSSFDVSLRGFMKQQTVAIKWYNGSSVVTLGTILTSNTGSGNKSFPVPSSIRGDHKVEADPPVGGSVSGTFAVKSYVKITPSGGVSGTNASIDLRGFVAGETVKTYFMNGSTKILVRTKTVSSTGAGTSTVTIPVSTTVGSHSIRAEGNMGSLATATYNVTSIGSSGQTPTPTATATSVPTESATPTPEVTEPPATEVPTETPTEVPTELPTEVPTEVPTEAPAETPVPEDSGTPAP